MELPENARRLLGENLRERWKKYAAFFGILLAWIPVYEVAGEIVNRKLYKVLITVGVYFVAGLGFLIYFMYSSLRAAYTKLGPEEPTHRHLSELSGKFFGVVKKEDVVSFEVLADGSSRSTNDVRLMAYTRNLTQIEYTSSLPSVPDDVEGSVEISMEPQQHSDVKITFEVIRTEKRACYWSINFVPALRPGEVVSYRYHQKAVPGSFATNVNEMKARGLEVESYSRCVTYPTERLQIRVAFERGIEPVRMHYDVWLGRGRVRHMPEYIRIETTNSFVTGYDEDGRIYCGMQISHPIQGLRYVVTWIPPKVG